jgi:membrane-bound inhibitor of C-type lysozyme
MTRNRIILILGVAAFALGALPARAQTFRNYSCADGARFIVGFYAYDKRAYLQVDGRPLTLARRLTVSGARYSAADVTLRIAQDGAVTLKHARLPVTACSAL